MSIVISLEAPSAEQARREIFALAGIHVPQEIPESLLRSSPSESLSLPAEFGAELQGGIYVGPHWVDGKLEHLIAAPETLPGAEWDDAQRIASNYTGPDDALVRYSDWVLPTREQLEIARIYAQEFFENGYHWSSTPCGSFTAWAVDFEYGDVTTWHRRNEFRVRPFRSVIA